jgi:hypothetical protein
MYQVSTLYSMQCAYALRYALKTASLLMLLLISVYYHCSLLLLLSLGCCTRTGLLEQQLASSYRRSSMR